MLELYSRRRISFGIPLRRIAGWTVMGTREAAGASTKIDGIMARFRKGAKE